MLTERHGACTGRWCAGWAATSWLGVGWPREYGGRGLGPVEQQIFVNEAARADVPLPAVTLQTVGPTLQAHGTAEQRSFFLPRILAGELHFAIGYTEPEAGTDLAALRTRAVRDGEEYVVNGQKIFTTGATTRTTCGWPAAPIAGRAAAQGDLDPDRGHPRPRLLLDPDHHPRRGAPRQRDVLRRRAGPGEMRVGAENGGWRLVTEQLNHERVMLGPAGRIAALHEAVRDWAAAHDGPDGRPLLAQPDVRRALGRTYAALRVNELLNWQVATADSGDIADASATKVYSSEQLQGLGAAARRGGRAARRPGRRGHGGAGPVAGHPGQAQHGADVRRRGQRDPAGADRDRRAGPAAGAAMTGARVRCRAAAERGGGGRGERAAGGPGPGEPADDPQLDRGAGRRPTRSTPTRRRRRRRGTAGWWPRRP